MKTFNNHRCLSHEVPSLLCVHIYLHSSDRETSVIVERFQLSFRVFVCAFCLEISSLVGKSFFFLFLFFLKIRIKLVVCTFNKINNCLYVAGSSYIKIHPGPPISSSNSFQRQPATLL